MSTAAMMNTIAAISARRPMLVGAKVKPMATANAAETTHIHHG
ncbi:hypothetical protein [Pseudoglutamicibacter albus]